MSPEDPKPNHVLQGLKHLILWRNTRQTLIVFTSVLMMLVDVMAHSVISVVSMAAIAGLLASISYRTVVQLFRKWSNGGGSGAGSASGSGDSHGKQMYDVKVFEIPREEIMGLSGLAVDYFNVALNRLWVVFLVESYEDSLKFLAIMCGLNLLGDCFNGLTMLIFGERCLFETLFPTLQNKIPGHILLFTLPKLYEWYKPLIDHHFQKLQIFQNTNPKMENAGAPTEEENQESEEEMVSTEENKESMLYKVFDLLEEEHSTGCSCRDCEHQTLPIEAH
ncbi:hypothetical protein KR018_006950 [Drosophila ironensis]|nr:hypothetical protein KR018_006950 [Drosophila ironensis]